MAFNEISNMNITGLDGMLSYVANEVPIFIPAMLFLLWLAIALLIYFGTRKFAGQGDFFAGLASSGFFIVVLGTVMTFSFGIINVWTLSTTIGIAIFSVIALFIGRRRD